MKIKLLLMSLLLVHTAASMQNQHIGQQKLTRRQARQGQRCAVWAGMTMSLTAVYMVSNMWCASIGNVCVYGDNPDCLQELRNVNFWEVFIRSASTISAVHMTHDFIKFMFTCARKRV